MSQQFGDQKSENRSTEDDDVGKMIGKITEAVEREIEGDTNDNSVGYHQITDNLIVTQNPERYLISQTDGTYRGLNKYTDAPKTEVPEDRNFISGEHLGNVETKEELCRALRSKNTCPMLIGDAGTAKNTSIDAVYSTLGQPVYRQQMGSGLTVFDLFAETELRDGDTVTTLKPFGLAAVFGGLAVVDEINLASSNLVANLNSMTEKRGQRRVSLPGTGVALSDLPEDTEWDADKHLGKYIHPEFRVIATRNPPSYAGAESLNNALNDRFSPIRYEYASIEAETSILAEDVGLDEDKVEPLVKVVHEDIRAARENNAGPMCPVSYRRLIDALEYARAHGATLYQGASEKIAGYAQNQADRDFIQGAFDDRKPILNISVSSNEETTQDADASVQCSNCDKAYKKNEKYGVCPFCDYPNLEDNSWSKDPTCNFISGFRWFDEEDCVVVSIWYESNNCVKTYKYTSNSRNMIKRRFRKMKAAALDKSKSTGSVYNKELKEYTDCQQIGKCKDVRKP